MQRDGDVQRKWSGSSDLSTATFKDLDTTIVSNASQRLAERLDSLQHSYELHVIVQIIVPFDVVTDTEFGRARVYQTSRNNWMNSVALTAESFKTM